MKWYVTLALVSVCLSFIAVEPALAAMDGGWQQMGGQGKAPDMMEQGKTLRADRGMHGMGFMHSAGNAYGEYVTFTIDSRTGAVLNYGIGGIPLFNISIADFNYGSNRTQGSVTWVSNMDGSTVIKLHDNPAAVTNILTNKRISVTFTLADGVTAEKEDDLVTVRSGDAAGYIVGSNITSSVSGTQVKIDTTPNSAVIFRAAPVNMPRFDHLYKRFSQEIATNRMGMEIAFGRNKTYSSINYSARMQLRVQAMEQDRITLQVNATEPAGRVIAIDLDNSSLVIGARERLRIHYDGQPMNCVDDPDMVLNGTDSPLCWISPIQERTRAQLMIYVPNFSEHTIDITVEPEAVETPEMTPANTTVVPTVTPRTPGFGLLVSLAGLLTWTFLTRRRNN